MKAIQTLSILAVFPLGLSPATLAVPQMQTAQLPTREQAPEDAVTPWWQGVNVFRAGAATTIELERLVNVVGLGEYLELESRQKDVQSVQRTGQCGRSCRRVLIPIGT
jgi:hypothetical protein